jgi:hypothetical protein
MNKPLLFIAALATATACLCVAQVVPVQPKLTPDFKNSMSAEEFKKAGLAKLSDDERKALENWVGNYSVVISKIMQAQPSGLGNGNQTWTKSQVTPIVLVSKDNFGDKFAPNGNSFNAPTWTKDQVTPMCLVKINNFGQQGFIPVEGVSVDPPTWSKDDVKAFVIVAGKSTDKFEAVENPVIKIK